MKNLLIITICLFISIASFAQNQVDIVKTFRVEKPAKIEVPGEFAIVFDNELPQGIVRMVLNVNHNASEELYQSHLLKRIKSFQEDNKIGFLVSEKNIETNTFVLEEKFHCVIYMNSETFKMKQ